MREIIATQSERVFNEQRLKLDRLDSWTALARWCDQIFRRKAKQGCRGGCPVGSLVGQLAEVDPFDRDYLAASFERGKAIWWPV